MTVLFRREWAMPSHLTYGIKPIKELIEKYSPETGRGFDVFPYGSKIDVLGIIKGVPAASLDFITLDPPYSPRQAKEMYRLQMDAVELTSLIKNVKDEIARVAKVGGLVLCFGWNSNGIGIGRGFELIDGLTVAHGGSHNDTICTVERKLIHA